MRWIERLLLLIACFFIASCGDWLRLPLPFPTPGQHDLVVLTRPGPLTYQQEDGENGSTTGLEHDLIEAFAQELGVGVEYVVVGPDELESSIARGRYHLAAAWLSPGNNPGVQATPAIFQSRDMLMQHEASLPLEDLSSLADKTVHVMAGSRQAATMRRLAKEVANLRVVEVGSGDVLDLIESLGNREVDYVAIDQNIEEIANQFTPYVHSTLTLSEPEPIVWLLGPSPNPELAEKARVFAERVQRDGTLAKLEDRYFGHVRRLNQADVTKFLGQIETTLPKLRRYFQDAQTVTGIDWRLVAAVAYHESHWDANATSFTGVRGIMMLTEETADRLGVSNRLNPRESILAGARYINMLKDNLPDEVQEPDRTWLALAAYNIGPGHFNAARTLAQQMNADGNAWFEMKRILPLLSKPSVYQRLKAGRARGGEAVILVENIRSYYDILVRNEERYLAVSSRMEGMVGMQGDGPGLKLKK